MKTTIKTIITLILIFFVSQKTFAETNYVGKFGTHAGNYFTDIQAAVDAALAGDLVLVSNGVYSTGGSVPDGNNFTNRVVISIDITVTSVSGPEKTFIIGVSSGATNCPFAVRCVQLSAGLLTGFTISNGCTQTSGDWGAYQRGGGVYFYNNGSISNCVICNCTANITGGGVDFHYGGMAVDSVIKNNSAGLGGGGVHLHDGALLNRCVVQNNSTSGNGAGLYFWSGGTVRNCLITGNSADNAGGGVYVKSGATDSQLENCTIVSNTGEYGGGIYAYGASIANSIIYDNISTLDSNSNWSCGNGTTSVFNYCCTIPMPTNDATSCITNNPQFVSSINKNWRLQSTSFCINSGTNAYVFGATDLAGSPRIIDGTVDIGCYEFVSVHYVTTNGAHIFPFATWENAATNIQDAVDAASPGALVLVSNGTYFITDDIDITNDLTVKTVSEIPELTIINPNNSARAFELQDFNITISGFTITNGNVGIGSNGGGIYCHSTKPVISNCVISSCYANSGGAVRGGSLFNCKLINNEVMSHGGGAYQSLLYFCEIADNEANNGGGLYNSTANNCKFYNNRVSNWGGGACESTLNNCLITRNSASYGGGTYKSTVNNCTITKNLARNYGGGTRNGTVNNSIVYYNSANSDSNKYGGTYRYCCTTPDGTNGVGNISDIPLLLSASQISTNSPCIGAGTNAFASGVDIDGEPWKNPPAIGCDEVYANAISGSLSVAIIADETYSYVGRSLTFLADIDGKISQNIWKFDDGTAQTNKYTVAHSWSEIGDYNLSLTAFNETYPLGISTSILVQIITNIHFVNINNSTPAEPYSSWQTAAINIQDAVDAAYDSGIVIVTNGEYILNNYISIYKELTVKSVNGFEKTIVDGNGNNRCFRLEDFYITLAGFTITNGYANGDDGAGIRCSSTKPIISNCFIVGNNINNEGYGGGVYRGSIYNSIIQNNSVDDDRGGGVYYSKVYNCMILGNEALDDYGGGACASELYNCTVVGNAADDGGGTYSCDIYNSIIWSNSATSVSNNCYRSDLIYSCTYPLQSGEGNISNYPEFVSYNPLTPFIKGDLMLHGNSPCINAGTNAYAPMPFDLNGNPRIIDAIVDMGCYEYAYPPFINITNFPAEIEYPETTAEISGTNVNIDGNLGWTNDKHPETTNFFPQGFSVTVSNLIVGENYISIEGTNRYFQSTNSVVCIRRKTLIESEPQIATNALIFPSANAILLAPFPTNIIWDIEKITDDLDGTNLIITKISVYVAETTNEVSIVTNDINNLLGEIIWLVPAELIGGDTNYVLKFEVVDSSSLTNSRIFWDNKFTVVPEPVGIIFSILFSVFCIWRKFIPLYFYRN